MTSQLMFAVLLIFVGIGLVVYENRTPRARALLGGLGINVFAAGLVLIIQTVYQNQWNILPYLAGGGVSAALTLAFVLYRHKGLRADLEHVGKDKDRLTMELENARADGARLRAEKEVAERLFDELQRQAEAGNQIPEGDIRKSGLTFYARNYAQYFKKNAGTEFGDYVRSFVLSSPQGSEFKIVGIDWTELFGAAVSATSEVYLPLLTDRRTTFKVILLDPRSRAGLEKRVSEFALAPDGKRRYVPNHEQRIAGKTMGAIEMIADYHKMHPSQFSLKLTADVPMVCAVLNGNEAVFCLYSRCHKGWDSPVFRATRVEGGIYEFLEEYFDYLWQNPLAAVSDQAWLTAQPIIASTESRLRQIVDASCTGPGHAACPELI